VISGSKEENMDTRTEKPDFVADEYGRVWEARYAPSVQRPASRPPTTSGRQVYLIPIPIGLLISLFALLFSSIGKGGSQPGAARFNEANAALDRGSFEQAIAGYGEAIGEKSVFPEAYFNRGLVYSASGDYELAIADFDQALQLNSGLIRAYVGRGLAYYALDETDEAIADFDQAIERTPASVSECWERAAKDDDQNLLNFCTVSSTEIDLPEVYADRGLAYLAKGDTGRAVVDLDKAIELQPALALAYYARGVARLTIGDYDLAVEDLDAVVRLDNDPDVRQKAEVLLGKLRVSPEIETTWFEQS
jgi:Tfp pilus assembly protein PilF